MGFYLKEINSNLFVHRNPNGNGYQYGSFKNGCAEFPTPDKAINIILNHSITDKFLDNRVFNIVHKGTDIVVCDNLVNSLKKTDITYTISEEEMAKLEAPADKSNKVAHSTFANTFLDIPAPSAEGTMAKDLSDHLKKFQASSYTNEKLKDGLSSLQNSLEAISSALSNLPPLESLEKELGDYNSEVIDIIHYIEFTQLDACNGYLIFKKLQDTLIHRRVLKEQIAIMQKLGGISVFGDCITKASEKIKEETIETKKYVPRIDTELFETGIVK